VEAVNPSIVRTLFRVAAIGEALSWVLLLAAMFCKWVLESEPFGLEEGGVPVAGMVHGGGFFLLYVLMTLVCHFTFRWSVKTTIVALLCAIPPFASIWFERKALRDDLLERRPATVPAA
jgi:integral membrane protein